MVVILAIYLPNAGFTEQSSPEKMPSERVQAWFINCQSELDSALLTLSGDCVASKSHKELMLDYRVARTKFKEIEFLISYIDPQQYNTYINGAPLPKLMKKVPDLTIIEPCGFQRLDELVNDEEIDLEAIQTCTEELREHLKTISKNMVQLQLSDPVIFEAARYGVLRINAMGVTGFDVPGNTDFALKEVAISLHGIQTAISFYDKYIAEDLLNNFSKLLVEAQHFVEKGSFEKLDRIAFHKQFADPLWRQLLTIQKGLKIELPNQRYGWSAPVNYESASMFSDDFLNAGYFGEFEGDSRDQKRIELGQMLFFDPVMSGNNQRACASCHQPSKGFTDGLPASLKIDGSPGNRNAPTILNSIYAERFFHDMRVDRLSAQVDHVVLNPDEFDGSYQDIILKLKSSDEYSSLFSEAYGKEGITANSINHAVTMYVASLRSFNSEFDRYMRGETDQLAADVRRGYNLFTGKAACATCHFAPTFSGLVPPLYSESESEVLGVPKAFSEPYELDSDRGRFMNRIIKEQAEFYRHAFKTPTIRNIEVTGPYMHNGAFTSLEDIVEFYNKGGGLGLGLNVPNQTLPEDELKLTKREKKDLIAFMKSLTDTTGLNQKPLRIPEINGSEELKKRQIGGLY